MRARDLRRRRWWQTDRMHQKVIYAANREWWDGWRAGRAEAARSGYAAAAPTPVEEGRSDG